MLDIPYLWIDALCIVQDSENDTMKQISETRHYYHNAFFGISASGCQDPNESFLDGGDSDGRSRLGHTIPDCSQSSTAVEVPFYGP